MPNMNIIDMGGRPGTPSKQRLALADFLIEQHTRYEQKEGHNLQTPWTNPQEPNAAHHDVRMLTDYADIWLFSIGAHAQLRALYQREQLIDSLDMIPIAVSGTDDNFIGILIDRQDPDKSSTDVTPKDDGVTITCLYRDPEWVGLNEQLHHCRDLKVHVFGYQDAPDEAHFIIATRPNAVLDDGPETHPNPHVEMNQALRDAVMWHGALSCTFHVSDQNKPADQPQV